MAASVSARLRALGATVLPVRAAGLAQETRTDINHFVVLLPRTSPLDERTGAQSAAIERLRSAAVISAQQANCLSLSYVQFGGISEGLDLAHGSFETASASAFAASVHLERPALNVRVVDFQLSFPAILIALILLAVLGSLT